MGWPGGVWSLAGVGSWGCGDGRCEVGKTGGVWVRVVVGRGLGVGVVGLAGVWRYGGWGVASGGRCWVLGSAGT